MSRRHDVEQHVRALPLDNACAGTAFPQREVTSFILQIESALAVKEVTSMSDSYEVVNDCSLFLYTPPASPTSQVSNSETALASDAQPSAAPQKLVDEDQLPSSGPWLGSTSLTISTSKQEAHSLMVETMCAALGQRGNDDSTERYVRRDDPVRLVKPDGVATAQRSTPFFSSVDQALAEMSLTKVKTEDGGENNCLLYAFKVASQQTPAKDQKTKYASPSSSTCTPCTTHLTKHAGRWCKRWKISASL